MREETRGHLRVIFGIFWCFGLLHAEVRNEKTQQTFVVRYKNGEQTIPVTVVLDFKKQTEHVINMSPRATTKTVTLYDFKQKTIAYKDLTNRECFLRQLTHETLNEETDALNRIHNPVDHQPKMLSLDPHRSSLTPTEIRNMAGQKTAVFCRKMNTWLILPRDAHNIQKREVDEIDERTFHRHGYHTVRYAHYGRETRRRFRNSNRNSTRHLSQRRRDVAEDLNKKSGSSNTNTDFDNTLPKKPSFTHHEFSKPGPLETELNANGLFVPPQFNHHTPSKITEKEGVQAFHSPSVSTNSNYNKILPTSHPNERSQLNEYEPQSSLHSDIGLVSHRRDKIDDTPYSRKESASNINGNLLSDIKEFPENHDVPYVSNNGTSSRANIPSPLSAIYNGDAVEEKNHLESPLYRTEFIELNTNPPFNINDNFHSNEENGQRGIESESISTGHHSGIPQIDSFPKFYDEHVVPEDPDVSTNVLEIPKVSKQFENFNHELHPSPITQTNEDVHDVFEGFFNLGKNHQLSGQGELLSSSFIPPETSHLRERTYPEDSLIDSYPALPHTSVGNDSGSSYHRRDNAFALSNTDVSSSTVNPSLTTSIFNKYNKATTLPSYSNTVTELVTIKNYEKPDDSQRINSISQENLHNYRKWEGITLKPIKNYKNDESSINKGLDSYFSTRVPSVDFLDNQRSSHRSDIPSEGDEIENVENSTPSNLEENSQIISETHLPSVVPTKIIHEGVPAHQVRFQNVLRTYKPDQIIIDLERIPTQRPPDSTLRLQSRFYSSDKHPNRRIPFIVRPVNEQKNEQATGETWNRLPVQRANQHNRRTNNFQTHYRNGASFQTRRNHLAQHHRRNESNYFQNRQHDYSNRHHTYPQPHDIPSHLNILRSHQQLNGLPPGVSIHPRHPKAPYADMFRSNMLPSIPQENKFRTLRPHRQRHHKKKDRFTNSCCRSAGKVNGSPTSCCRAGSSCCSAHRGRVLTPKTPCCSSTKHSRREQPFPPSQNQMPVQNKMALNQVRNTVEDHRDRCQKEKMCRTLYESTQQVMVKHQPSVRIKVVDLGLTFQQPNTVYHHFLKHDFSLSEILPLIESMCVFVMLLVRYMFYIN